MFPRVVSAHQNRRRPVCFEIDYFGSRSGVCVCNTYDAVYLRYFGPDTRATRAAAYCYCYCYYHHHCRHRYCRTNVTGVYCANIYPYVYAPESIDNGRDGIRRRRIFRKQWAAIRTSAVTPAQKSGGRKQQRYWIKTPVR